MVKVTSFQAVVENAKIPVVDVVLFRWVIPHETVTKVVDCIVVDGHEIPRLVLHECSSSRVNGRAVRYDLKQHLHPRIFLRLIQILAIHFMETRNKGQQLCLSQLGGMKTQFLEFFLQPSWMNGAVFERPFLEVFTDSALIIVRNHYTVRKFFDGIGWPPSHHDRAKAVLIENIPDRLCLA